VHRRTEVANRSIQIHSADNEGAANAVGESNSAISRKMFFCRPKKVQGLTKSSMEILIAKYHLHPIIDHFTIALLAIGVLADVIGYTIVLFFRNGGLRINGLAERLSGAVLLLLIPGAISAILSRLTGESEAERVWDTISPAAQQILFSDTGSARLLSHAVLGTYLTYAFVALAAWRVLLEIRATLKRTQLVYLAVAMVALCGLLYQGKTGGELVYNHGAGTTHAQTTSQQSVVRE
jgi:uncharacterized membrane protein